MKTLWVINKHLQASYNFWVLMVHELGYLSVYNTVEVIH